MSWLEATRVAQYREKCTATVGAPYDKEDQIVH